MKYREVTADCYKISDLHYDHILLVKGPFTFTWGDEIIEPKEIVVDFSREMSGTFDLEISKEEIDLLWETTK